MGGATLTTPQLYQVGAWKDVWEPMKYVHDKFITKRGRKSFAVGCSMGGAILGNLLGHLSDECPLEAAFVVHAPVKMWENDDHIRNLAYGSFDYLLGQNLNALLLKHEPQLREHFKTNLNIDIQQTIKEQRPSILGFDSSFTVPAFGYKDREDYYRRTAPYFTIP